MFAVPTAGQSSRAAASAASASAADRADLQKAPDPVQVDYVGGGEGTHEYPFVQLIHQEPLMDEQPERLPDRVTRHVQRRRDVLLTQPAARLAAPVGDRGTQRVRDPLRGAAAIRAAAGQVRGQVVARHGTSIGESLD
jgi:hypothetical protein